MIIMEDREYMLNLIKSSDEFNHTYDKVDFVIDSTKKEQYLDFKDLIKSKGHHHYIYVAYYAFKHRIGCDYENGELVDNMKLREYLDNEIIKCWKMLYNGESSYMYGGGGDCMKYEAIPNFKKRVIETYNRFATLKYESNGTNK